MPASERMVLVCLSGVQSNIGRVGRAASATNLFCCATRRRSDPSQARAWRMRRSDQDRIGGRPGEHVEVDEAWGWRLDARQRPRRPATRFLSPALWRFASASRAPSSTSGRVVAMPGGFGSPSCRTAARSCSAASLSAPLCRARRSLPTTGAATPALPCKGCAQTPRHR